ncbi:MAG: M28 family peptidase [Candidatus Latescibacteria bacterium]|jgi:hypothetical protein|nr:M28 family peptidase [Candidatus Latescibacterota bacterium]
MDLDWRVLDRWMMGEAYTGSSIEAHAVELCDNIGPRWSSSEAEQEATAYIRGQMEAEGLDRAELEPYDLETWSWSRAEARADPGEQAVDVLPFNRCPTTSAIGPIVDVGFGTEREVEEAGASVLDGAIALMQLGLEPFTTPVPHAYRLQSLAKRGAVAAVVIEKKVGRRMEYHSASDWRDSGLREHPLPTVVTPLEHGLMLRRFSQEGRLLHLEVESELQTAPSANVVGEIEGVDWPNENLLLGAHHDTVYGSPGGNDNASGTIAVMETSRVLARLREETGVGPGRSIRFVTFSAEEQKLQGASAYVERHQGGETPPRLAINLDELSTGSMKGIVLGFPHLRTLVQRQLDDMNEGLTCHVMAQLDASSDHFPFIRAGIDAAHLWRWRFHGRHASSDFHHEAGDTSDKIVVRELKEYVGLLARLLLRLSHVPPEEWPENRVTVEEVQARLEAERGEVVRVY